MSHIIAESEIEQVALDILSDLGYKVMHGPDIAPDGERPERKNYADVILVDRLKRAVEKINPSIPQSAQEDAIKKLLRLESPDVVVNNQRFHRYLVEGIDVEFRKGERIVGDKVWLIDFAQPNHN